MRQNISSGTPWEEIAGYSRAVRLDNSIFVSGTTASDEDGKLVGGNDPYEQTKYILQKVDGALAQVGASLSDVVRTRIYVVDINDWKEVARAHREFFGEIRPANSLIQVGGLVEGRLVEIEVDALIAE